LTRKTSLLRKIEPIARRSGFAKRIIYNLDFRLTTRAKRRNDPEIMRGRAIACTIQLGSISSLRCQKTRNARSGESNTCEVMFRGRSSTSTRSAIKPSGGARRDRTDDLMLAKHALSQLSYGPITRRRMPRFKETRSIEMVGLGRLELPTSRLSSARSNQLSYKPQAQEA
jgi:hypothetical protein